MNTSIAIRTQLTQAIAELPLGVLPELASFIEYLRFKSHSPQIPPASTISSGSIFLRSIAGLGSSEEDDVSQRDEEILGQEIDSRYGWTLKSRDSL